MSTSFKLSEEMKIKSKIIEDFVLNNKYIPHIPFFKQMDFLSLPDREAMYGGSAGGGKSDALLMASLMFVDFPGYNAIIFRKTFADLALPDAIMSRSKEWLMNTDATWNGSDYRWTFPSGATLSFGYLNHDKDKFRYQSAQFQFVGFDEATHFLEDQYLYLFSRLRKLSDSPIPLRMRGATNPGGVGHQWVFERFIVDDSRPFVSSSFDDNAYIDKEEYERNLKELDDTTYKQLKEGLWVQKSEGESFDSEYWRGKNRFIEETAQNDSVVGRWISFDTAFENKKNSAYTAYCVGELLPNYSLRIRRVWRGKPTFPELPNVMLEVAKEWNFDGKLQGIIIEGQASGKPAIQTLRAGIDKVIAKKVIEFNPKGSKEERWGRAGVWCKRNLVKLPFPSLDSVWLGDFETEIFNLENAQFKDQADCFAQLIIYLENYLISAFHGQAFKQEVKKSQSRVKEALLNKRKQTQKSKRLTHKQKRKAL